MRSHPVLIVAGLGVAALGLLESPHLIHAQTAPAPTRAVGRGFTVSAPKGFTVVRDGPVKHVVDAGGVVLVSAERSAPSPSGAPGFRASIVIVPVPAPIQGDLGAAAFCGQLAEGSAAKANAGITGRKIIAASWGPACQYEITEKSQPNRGAIGTLAYRGTSGWVITCNLDPKDERARSACNEVVRSWKFSS